jgi:hypothetical protein
LQRFLFAYPDIGKRPEKPNEAIIARYRKVLPLPMKHLLNLPNMILPGV